MKFFNTFGFFPTEKLENGYTGFYFKKPLHLKVITLKKRSDKLGMSLVSALRGSGEFTFICNNPEGIPFIVDQSKSKLKIIDKSEEHDLIGHPLLLSFKNLNTKETITCVQSSEKSPFEKSYDSDMTLHDNFVKAITNMKLGDEAELLVLAPSEDVIDKFRECHSYVQICDPHPVMTSSF